MRDGAHRIEEAMLLVGGEGTRLRSVVSDRPKPMAIVAGRPFLDWLVAAARSLGVRRMIMCTGYMSEVIEAHFGDGQRWDVEVEYSRDPFPLGTGGSVLRALGKIRSRRFLVMNGDSYCPVDIRRLAAEHILSRAAATIWLTHLDDRSRYGAVSIDESGRVMSFHEKSAQARPGLVNAGIYAMERETAEAIPENTAVSLETDFFPGLIGHGLYGVPGNGVLIDIGTPESYAASERYFGRIASDPRFSQIPTES